MTIGASTRAEVRALRQNTIRRGMIYMAMVGLFFAWAGPSLPLADRLYWLALTVAVCAYQFAFVWKRLDENRKDPDGPVYPTFGWANEVTLLRGVLFSMLAGFLFSPSLQGPIAWAPGLLYLAAVLLDFADGYLARVTGRVTRLGAMLDMEWDSLGFLIATGVGIFHTKIQAVYLILGVARFLFVYGIRRRERAHLPVYELDSSMIRRALAGSQMGFLGVALLPVFPGLVTQAASVFFMLPSVAHFWRDWLWVSGQFRPSAPVRAWLPLVFRGALVVLVGWIVWRQVQSGTVDGLSMVVYLLALPALITGAAGRIAALGVMLVLGLALRDSPGSPVHWLALLAGIGVMMGGTGPYSLWTPENWLIYHHAGERPTAQRTH